MVNCLRTLIKMGKYDSDFLFILRELHKEYVGNFEDENCKLIEKLYSLLDEL